MAKTAIRPFGMVPVELLQDKAARNYVCVYAALASFQGSNEDCFPGYDKIAERAGCDRSNAIRGVKALIKTGWIAKVSTGGQIDGKNVSNHYAVMFPVNETTPADADDIPGGSSVDATPSSSVDATPVVAHTPPYKIIEKNSIKEDEETPVKSSSISFNQWIQVIKPRAEKSGHYLNPSSPLAEAFKHLAANGLETRYEYLDELFAKYRGKPTGHLVTAMQSLEDRPRELFAPNGQPAKPIEPRAVELCPVCGNKMTPRHDDLHSCDHCHYHTNLAEVLTTIQAAYKEHGLEGVDAYLEEISRPLDGLAELFKKTA